MFSVCSPELHWNHIQQSHLGGKRDGQITAQIAEIEIDIIYCPSPSCLQHAQLHCRCVAETIACVGGGLWTCGRCSAALVAVGITVSAVGTPSVYWYLCKLELQTIHRRCFYNHRIHREGPY